ncbi:putative uncharacterized protein [Waddlia chondrophila 2032/99]|uniref:OSBS enolase-like N-terminal domain-containing protein n=1 Tax=Waddlia chondrophila 2032/99 TaxID=765953 RepID=F8LDJ6_9BACT|nr:putative uncharacterized protein [Waddlia chondrophila 2032/99]
MNIRFSLYQLISAGSFPSREGALLEFTFEDETVGYADCHPWTELGDAPLKQQLFLLRQRRITPLMARSLDFALVDSHARAKKMNLFEGVTIPKSHCLIDSVRIPEGFDIYKCKDPQLCLELLPQLAPGKKIRMDFNNKLTKDQYIEFIERANPFIKRLDFIEDPFPFDQKLWKEFEQKYGVPIALDRAREGEGHSLKILKPAIDPPVKLSKEKRYLFTSYLDHPIGQAAAAYSAAISGCKETCGLMTHLIYRTNMFSQRFSVKDSRLVVPKEGYGFGFDDCLKKQNWRRLC